MKNNFWEKLKKSNKLIYALAPMAGITDSAFRQICKEFGADVVYSEMASATALAYNPKKTLEMLQSSKKEAPCVIQLFGNSPENFAKSVKLLTNKKEIAKFQVSNFKLPQGIDINFGCPVKKVIKQGAGAALMQDLKLSREVIKSVIDNTDLPVSIKLRSKVGTGCNLSLQIDCLRFLDYMKDLPISAVMIHGRTSAQGFSGPVDAEIIKKARNYFNGIILANGGVMDCQDARNLLNKTEADGIGIARGALGKPWIFEEVRSKKLEVRSNDEIFRVALKHAKLVEKLKGEQGIIEMRKHLCWYVHGLSGACEMRERLVKVETIKDIEKILK
ncbi:tRNA-dihydrouridine synthase [Patescibacteria group bacterium]|nr:tRNA-dihydrouridine synthase [Patescibacteria group bacterium]MCG2700622.1 tRNA-dihydrouridine synthase [Candidatus Parcubacteria bacterium]